MELVLPAPGIWATFDLSDPAPRPDLAAREIVELWDDLDDPAGTRHLVAAWLSAADDAGETDVAIRIDDRVLSDVTITQRRYETSDADNLADAFAATTGTTAPPVTHVLGGTTALRRIPADGLEGPLVEFWFLDPGTRDLVCVQFSGGPSQESIEELARVAMTDGGWFDPDAEPDESEFDDPVGFADYEAQEA